MKSCEGVAIGACDESCVDLRDEQIRSVNCCTVRDVGCAMRTGRMSASVGDDACQPTCAAAPFNDSVGLQLLLGQTCSMSTELKT